MGQGIEYKPSSHVDADQVPFISSPMVPQGEPAKRLVCTSTNTEHVLRMYKLHMYENLQARFAIVTSQDGAAIRTLSILATKF